MTQLLRYKKLYSRQLTDGEIWVAIVTGSPKEGGTGILVAGSVAKVVAEGVTVLPLIAPGDPFRFGDDSYFADHTAERQLVDLGAAPDHVVGAWMKFHHLGRLTV